jgi:hypothetical protein
MSESTSEQLEAAAELTVPAAAEEPALFVPRPLRSIQEIVADLKKPIASKHLSTRKQGGQTLTYISWYHAIKYLDYYAPGWSYAVNIVQVIGKDCVVTVRLSIPCLEGIVSRDATGIETLNVSGYGDTSSNAESMALRRAAAKFGLGLSLYDK